MTTVLLWLIGFPLIMLCIGTALGAVLMAKDWLVRRIFG